MNRLILLLAIISFNSFANGTNVGGGGIGAITEEGFIPRDLVRDCRWYSGEEIKKRIPKLEELYESIDDQNFFLKSFIERVGNRLQYCMTKRDLKVPTESIKNYIVDYKYKNKTIAIRDGEKVYINEKLFEKLSPLHRAILFVHESSHGLFHPYERQENLENFIEIVHQNYQLKMSRDQFKRHLELNEVQIYKEHEINNPKYKKLFTYAYETTLDDWISPQKMYQLIKALLPGEVNFDEQTLYLDIQNAFKTNKGQKFGKKIFNLYFELNKDIFDAIKNKNESEIQKMFKEGLDPNHNISFILKCSPKSHPDRKTYYANSIDCFQRSDYYSYGRSFVHGTSSDEYYTSIYNLAIATDSKEITKIIQSNKDYKRDSEFYSYELRRKVDLRKYILKELFRSGGNSFYIFYPADQHQVITKLSKISTGNILHLPSLLAENLYSSAEIKISFLEYLFGKISSRIDREYFFVEHHEYKYYTEKVPDEGYSYEEYLESPLYKRVESLQTEIIEMLQVKNINFFNGADLKNIFWSLNRKLGANVYVKGSARLSLRLQWLIPIWKEIVNNKILLSNLRRNTKYRYKKSSAIRLLEDFIELSNNRDYDYSDNPYFCDIFKILTESELLNNRISENTIRALLKLNPKDTLSCNYRSLILNIRTIITR